MLHRCAIWVGQESVLTPCSWSGGHCQLIQLPLCCYPHPAMGLKHDCKFLSPRALRQHRCSSGAVQHPSATGMRLQHKSPIKAVTRGQELRRRADLHQVFHLNQTRTDQSSKPCLLAAFCSNKAMLSSAWSADQSAGIFPRNSCAGTSCLQCPVWSWAKCGRKWKLEAKHTVSSF